MWKPISFICYNLHPVIIISLSPRVAILSNIQLTDTINSADVNIIPGVTPGFGNCNDKCPLALLGFCSKKLENHIRLSVFPNESQKFPDGDCHLEGSLLTLIGNLTKV